MNNKALQLVELKKHVDTIYPDEASHAHIDLNRITELAERGLTVPMIAAMIGISAQELKARISSSKMLENAIKAGVAKGVEAVASALYENAVEGKNLAAQIFFLKAVAGWRDSDNGKGGGVGGAAPAGSKKQVKVYLPDNGRS